MTTISLAERLTEFKERRRVWPVPGFRRVSRGASAGHLALDIPAAAGTPAVAASRGVVTAIRPEKTGFGLNVRIRTPEGVELVYAHMRDVAIRVGQRLAAGDIVGAVGFSGTTDPIGPSGAHLHFEARQPGRDIFKGRLSTTSALDPWAFLGDAISIPAPSYTAPEFSPDRGTSLRSRFVPPSFQMNKLVLPGIDLPLVMDQPTAQKEKDPGPFDIGEQLVSAVGRRAERTGFIVGGALLIMIGIIILSAGLREKAMPAVIKIAKTAAGAAAGGPVGAAAGAIV